MTHVQLTCSKAQWDLGLHGDRVSTGGEQFFSLNEQKMLQLTLPLLKDGQDSPQDSCLKIVQLFLVKHEHFHTAVNYLSKDVGMRHVPLEHRLANKLDAAAPEQPFEWHQPRGLSGSPMMGPPVRISGQASNQGLRGHRRQSLAPPVQRPYSVNPNSNVVHEETARHSVRSSSALPFHRPIDPKAYHFPPNLPRGPRGAFPQNGLSQRQRLLSRSPAVESARKMAQQYEIPMRRASVVGNTPSGFPLQHNGREPMPSHHQDRPNTDYVRDGFHHHTVHRESAYLTGHLPSSASKTYLYQPSPSSSIPRETPTPRLRPESALGRLVRIEVLDPYAEDSHPHSHSRTLWAFSLNLLPSTKMWELCVHAARYLNQHFEVGLDGKNLAAQGADGTAFGDQETVSAKVDPEETVFLAERNPLGAVHPNHADFRMSSMDALHPDWTSPAPDSEVPDPLSSRNKRRKLHFDAIDEDNQVPPPRELPFPSVTPAPLLRPSSSTAQVRPLSERQNLANASAGASERQHIAQPINENDRTITASKKQPATRTTRPQSVMQRPASKKQSVSRATRPQSAMQRPDLGARSGIVGLDSTGKPGTPQTKKGAVKTPSNQEAVPPAIPLAKRSRPSAAEIRPPELATTACMGCRIRKRQCDKARPTCGACLADNKKCVYLYSQSVEGNISGAEQASKEHTSKEKTHSMALRSDKESPITLMQSIATQTSQARETRDMRTQTQEIEQEKEVVHMKHMGTDPCSVAADASTETDRCDDIWIPFSRCAEVVVWATRRHEEKLEAAADVFRSTDSSQKDYKEKVYQAAVHGYEFQMELRNKCEEVLSRPL